MRGQEDPHWERRRVEELRARKVSWQHIAQQLGRSAMTLRQLYGERAPAVLPSSAASAPAQLTIPTKPSAKALVRVHADANATLAVLAALADGAARVSVEITDQCGCTRSAIHAAVRYGLVRNSAGPGVPGVFRITPLGRERLKRSQKVAA